MNFTISNRLKHIGAAIQKTPDAFAMLRGGPENPALFGGVFFHRLTFGTLITADISGLPAPADPCKSPVFGFHIHEGTVCGGDMSDPFGRAMTHYNPGGCDHPYHAGDMPPLFAANGYAYLSFVSGRFSLSEIIGRVVIIHSKPDDFKTQPSGDSGVKIACGVIEKI